MTNPWCWLFWHGGLCDKLLSYNCAWFSRTHCSASYPCWQMCPCTVAVPAIIVSLLLVFWQVAWRELYSIIAQQCIPATCITDKAVRVMCSLKVCILLLSAHQKILALSFEPGRHSNHGSILSRFIATSLSLGVSSQAENHWAYGRLGSKRINRNKVSNGAIYAINASSSIWRPNSRGGKKFHDHKMYCSGVHA